MIIDISLLFSSKITSITICNVYPSYKTNLLESGHSSVNEEKLSSILSPNNKNLRNTFEMMNYCLSN